MPSVAFAPRFPSLVVLVPMPDKPVGADDVRSFLTSNGFVLEYVGATADGAICIKVKDLANTVLLARGMVLCVLPEQHDIMAMSSQVLDVFYEPVQPNQPA